MRNHFFIILCFCLVFSSNVKASQPEGSNESYCSTIVPILFILLEQEKEIPNFSELLQLVEFVNKLPVLMPIDQKIEKAYRACLYIE